MTTSNTSERAPLTVGSRVTVAKGCRALGIDKGVSATVTEISPMGADYSHACRIVVTFRNGFSSGKSRALWVRHANRLGDALVRANNGDPTKFVELVRSSK